MRVLVTGANSGLGRASAQALAARGYAVILAARSDERTRPVLDDLRRRYPSADLDFLQLDLASFASISRRRRALCWRPGGRWTSS